MKIRKRHRSSLSTSDLVPDGRASLTALTGLDRLPRPVQVDDEIRGDLARSQRAPRSLGAVYPWAAPKARNGLRTYPHPYPAKQIFRAGSDLQRAALKLPYRLKHPVPGRVAECVRRKSRREVLFAKGRAGYSGSARKKQWRRTPKSQYGC